MTARAGVGALGLALLAILVFLAPSQFEAAFVSLAHSEVDLAEAALAAAAALVA
jgi:glutamate-1-semialdehyde aminotransferase